MTAITQSKPHWRNRCEGLALSAIFQGFPTFAAAVLILKLTGAHEIVGERGGAAIFVVLASLVHALLTPWLARRFPRHFRHAHETLFYDGSLSFPEKIAKWRIQPTASLQLVTSMLMLSLLAVGVTSMR